MLACKDVAASLLYKPTGGLGIFGASTVYCDSSINLALDAAGGGMAVHANLSEYAHSDDLAYWEEGGMLVTTELTWVGSAPGSKEVAGAEMTWVCEYVSSSEVAVVRLVYLCTDTSGNFDADWSLTALPASCVIDGCRPYYNPAAVASNDSPGT